MAQHSQIDCRIIVIDDGSMDSAVQQLLDSYRSRWPFECYRNPTNMGFTRTVNQGVQLAGSAMRSCSTRIPR
ncbi:glycosyltransferase family 2 protein [Halomonas urumqiensis]|uniref:glycosyltransferase family 2 protein n=1 Tax=Halomonas urumqiensis TaxID=1684789 RepID=UPI0035716B36